MTRIPRFRLLLALVLTGAFLTACEDLGPETGTETEQPKPVITSITPSTLTPGSTATLSGSNFGLSAADNVVTVGGVAAELVTASETQLTVTLASADSYACNATQDVEVAVRVSGSVAAAAHPLQVAVQRSVAAGEWLLLEGDDDLACNELSAGSYVMTVTNASHAIGSDASFRLVGQAAGSTSSLLDEGTSSLGAPGATARARPQVSADDRPRLDLHDRILGLARETPARVGPPEPSATPSRLQASFSSGLPQPGDIGSVLMPDWSIESYAGMCEGVLIDARVVYVGDHTIVLEDTSYYAAGELDDLLAGLAMEYEQDMLPVLTSNFGDPVAFDADDDGRIYMLFSPAVNELSPGALGIVWGDDRYTAEQTGCAASNQAEIFYARMPEDQTLDEYWYEMRPTLIHEAKHVLSFGERAVVGSEGEESWLEESTAMIAEELWARLHYDYRQGTNATYAESLWCENPMGYCGPYVMYAHFGYFYDYMAGTEAQSPLGGDGTANFYGSGWSLVRWAIDQHAGAESTLLAELTRTTEMGVDNLLARTGLSYGELLGGWALALATDDLEGFTPSDPAITMPSWNLPDIFAGMNEEKPEEYAWAHPLEVRQISAGAFDVSVSPLLAGSASFFHVPGSGSAPHLVSVQSSGGAAPPSTLGLAIVRVQ